MNTFHSLQWLTTVFWMNLRLDESLHAYIFQWLQVQIKCHNTVNIISIHFNKQWGDQCFNQWKIVIILKCIVAIPSQRYKFYSLRGRTIAVFKPIAEFDIDDEK